MLVALDGAGPVYQQIYRALRERILTHALPAGTRLASSRAMARDLGVARNTVLQAYEQLLAEGYVVGRIGAGTFVADELPDSLTAPPIAAAEPVPADQTEFGLSAYAQRAQTWHSPLTPRARPLRYDFRYGLPGIREFPFEVWRRLLTRRARNAELDTFTYGPPEGRAELRHAIAGYLGRSRGVRCSPEQVIIVNGSQQGLDLVARALLDPGDVVLIEEPSYPGAREVFRAAGARLVLGSVDADGLTLDGLPPIARRARLVHVTPSHQFPGGAVMPLARRLSLLAWAKATGCYVVEDDYDSEFRYDGRPVEAVQALDRSGQVIYLGTLSKTLYPALRMGYLVVPPTLVGPLRTIKLLADRHTSTLQQDVLTDFIGEGHFERHLRRARVSNGRRRAAVIAAVEREFGDRVEVQGANAGLHLMLWLNEHGSAELPDVVARAEASGVGIYPVTSYYVEPPPRAGLVLGYAALDEVEIDRGIALLARALASAKAA
ncbi:MocR-like pyridoxine biosynthesis transcription factor PdxR [Chelatococcus reniformis]|uniref:GntR family transcriptional regulator n=1 Tax=Chelatococcus reniformis TaxID=1494448 RepID=A0A916U3C0_9HYPH|nr:PLP-dependent aminotransferase family protein [Chelatococcus reniformis]GGC58506.1 GntR family transcriptional regulator [Chelatococcus reniformis]